MGKYTTFHNCNVFKGLVSTLPRATVKDTQPNPTGTPPANDLNASSSTSKAEVEEDTQPSPMGTPSTDDHTIPPAIPEAEIEEDLPATQSTSPAKFREDSVALTAILADQQADPPTLDSSMGIEGKEYLEWIKVHSSCKAAAMGSTPHNPGESSGNATATLGGRKELVASWRRSGGTLGMFLGLPHLKAPQSQCPRAKRIRVLS